MSDSCKKNLSQYKLSLLFKNVWPIWGTVISVCFICVRVSFAAMDSGLQDTLKHLCFNVTGYCKQTFIDFAKQIITPCDSSLPPTFAFLFSTGDFLPKPLTITQFSL